MLKQITANELTEKLDADESFALIDTRPEDSYEAWHIAKAENVPFPPGGELSEEQLRQVDETTDGQSIVAICGKGLSSTSFAAELDDNGYDDVTVVKGGMEDWSTVYEVVPVQTRHNDLVVRQLQRRAKGCLGYIIGSHKTGEAVAVDATRQTDVFKIAAQEADLTITRVLDTHIHADHISGGRQLARELDVPYHLSGHLENRDTEIEYAFEPLQAGDVLSVGEIEIEVLHTPGHTSEMINLLVDDDTLLTSDTLFLNGVGRTELQFGEEDAAHGAELLYESANNVLAAVDDDTAVLPGHVTVTQPGTFESGSPGNPIEARLGDLRNQLDVFTLEEEAFVEELTERSSERPQNYETIIALNVGSESVDRNEEATELELGPNNCSA